MATVETERKYDVPPGWSLPELTGIADVATVAPPQHLDLEAVYFDTPCLALLRAGRVLRRRIGGHDAGWHVKLPRQGDERLEIREPLGDRAGRAAGDASSVRVPASVRAHVVDVVGSAPLVPVAVLRTRRTVWELTGPDQTALVEIADDAVEAQVLLGGESVQQWHEVEAELLDGQPATLAAVADELENSGLTPAAGPSKVGRALVDVLADVQALAHGDREPTAGDVVMAYLAAQVGVLQASEPAVRADAPDAVHKARVATRRLRSALRTFRPLFDRAVTDPLRGEVAWLTGALGGPRDAEVMRDRLLELLGRLEPELMVGSVASRVRDTLLAEHEQAHAALLEAVDSPRYERLMERLVDLLVVPPVARSAGDPAYDGLAGRVARAAQRVTKAAAKAASSDNAAVRDVALHETRKRAKAARYAAEAAGEVIGTQALDVVAAWTDLQDALGEYQDSVVARQVIMRICEQARVAGEETFTYGVLAERETAVTRAVRAEYAALLAKALAAVETVSAAPRTSSDHA